ncbi:unnamed protein product [Colias eurytheme]|nr:unnamed protein product [Colias eurytheme]
MLHVRGGDCRLINGNCLAPLKTKQELVKLSNTCPIDSALHCILIAYSLEENTADKTINEFVAEVSQNRSNPEPSTSRRNFSNNEHESTSVSATNRRNIETFKRPHGPNQKYKTPSKIIHAKKQMEDTFERLQTITSQKREQLDEYDHFMIASKIRKLQDPDDRAVLMNSIQNIAFEFYMKKKRPRSSSSVHSSPVYQYQQSDEENTNSPQPQMQLYSSSPTYEIQMKLLNAYYLFPNLDRSKF